MGYASQANWNVTHSGGISFLATRLVETGGSACFEGTRGFMIVKNMFFTQKTLKSKILNPKGILSNVALPNMFNITCSVTIRTGMRSIPVSGAPAGHSINKVYSECLTRRHPSRCEGSIASQLAVLWA